MAQRFKAVRFVGEKDFQKFGTLSKNMYQAYEPFRLEYLRSIRLKVEVAKQIVFAAQDWEPLSENYKAFKSKAGLSPLIWEAYGQTFKRIQGIIARNTVYVGIRSGFKHSESGTDLRIILQNMEEGYLVGDTAVPARPIIEPTIELVGQMLDKEKNYRAYRLLYQIKAKGNVKGTANVSRVNFDRNYFDFRTQGLTSLDRMLNSF